MQMAMAPEVVRLEVNRFSVLCASYERSRKITKTWI